MTRAATTQAAIDGLADKALGALLGGAMGDALGMPTQTMSRAEIADTYGTITDFVAPSDNHPVSHGLPAAAVTDDTEQALLLAEYIMAAPETFDEERWARALLAWETSIKRRALRDLLGPSTKRALEALLTGAPVSETGRFGDTNGAAMRIAPVGIATPVEPLSGLVDRVEAVCRVTHNTATAIAAAAAVAAAISAGIDGASVDDAATMALAAAREGEGRGHGRDGVDLADRIANALAIAARRKDDTAWLDEVERIGTTVACRESVPVAFAIFTSCGGDAWRAGLISANIGGDTDTIGAMAAGMAGACGGAASLPADRLARLIEINGLELDGIARGLLTVRRARRGAAAYPAFAP